MKIDVPDAQRYLSTLNVSEWHPDESAVLAAVAGLLDQGARTALEVMCESLEIDLTSYADEGIGIAVFLGGQEYPSPVKVVSVADLAREYMEWNGEGLTENFAAKRDSIIAQLQEAIDILKDVR